MKFSIQASQLKKVLSSLRRHTNPRSPMPILKCFLFEVKDSLAVTATDLVTTVTLQVGADIALPGSLSVPAPELCKIVNKLSGELWVYQEENGCILESSRGRFRIDSYAGEEFPNEHNVKDTYREVEIPHHVLEQAASQTAHVVGDPFQEGSTPRATAGVQVTLSDGVLTMVGTDGRRVAVSRVEAPTKEETEAVILPDVLTSVISIVEKSENVTVGISDRRLRVRSSDLTVTSLQLSGRFPQWQKIVPRSKTSSWVADREALMEVVDQALVFAIEKKSPNTIRFLFEPERAWISSLAASVGDAKIEMPGRFEGDSFELWMNGSYLMDALKVMRGPQALFEMQGDCKQLIVKDPESESFKYVLAPVKPPTVEPA